MVSCPWAGGRSDQYSGRRFTLHTPFFLLTSPLIELFELVPEKRQPYLPRASFISYLTAPAIKTN